MEAVMSKYLVVAHQTATSPALLDKLREIAAEDLTATFTLIVPATPIEHLLTKHEGEAIAVAEQSAAEARALVEHHGLRVDDAIVGDASPLQAIDDFLQDSPSATYDGIVISTLSPGISRWLKLDVHARARQRFDVPVISVIAPRTEIGATTRS
jgi:nucleotide-binding universal stress UspA family protein